MAQLVLVLVRGAVAGSASRTGVPARSRAAGPPAARRAAGAVA
jgi:hypothetical protein